MDGDASLQGFAGKRKNAVFSLRTATPGMAWTGLAVRCRDSNSAASIHGVFACIFHRRGRFHREDAHAPKSIYQNRMLLSFCPSRLGKQHNNSKENSRRNYIHGVNITVNDPRRISIIYQRCGMRFN